VRSRSHREPIPAPFTTARPLVLWVVLALVASTFPACSPLAPRRPLARDAFRIQVIDQSTGRGVPAVELRTIDQRRFVTDSTGTIAFLEPDLLGHRVFFHVRSFGYRLSESAGKQGGVVLETERGGSARLSLFRENVAERLYRVTGSGIERDVALLDQAGGQVLGPRGEPIDPLLGTDSALCITYDRRLLWIFGDTVTAANPLANYRATGAFSPLPSRAGFDPLRELPLEFLRGPAAPSGDGRVPAETNIEGTALRPMVADPYPVIWLSALRQERGADGSDPLYATYSKIGQGMSVHEQGIAKFDPVRGQFVPGTAYPKDAANLPDGHAYRYDTRGQSYIYYDLGLRAHSATAPARAIEAFTPLRVGARIELGPTALERDTNGRLVWGWKPDTSSVSEETWQKWIAAGHVSESEGWLRLTDVVDGKTIVPHHGSIRWNPYRQRWVMVRSQLGGDSFLGEVYYGEADTPLGPWAYVRKVATHTWIPTGPNPLGDPEQDRWSLSFYNPVHCPELDVAGGRVILFQGTLSTFLAPKNGALPGYDYNQLMYSLDLDDPRLRLPVAIYQLTETDPRVGTRLLRIEQLRDLAAQRASLPTSDNEDERSDIAVPEAKLAFFAPDRAAPGLIPVVSQLDDSRGHRLLPATEQAAPLFYCAPSAKTPNQRALIESVDVDGHWIYQLSEPDLRPPDAPRGASTAPPDADTLRPKPRILCYVWAPPIEYPDQIRLPEL